MKKRQRKKVLQKVAEGRRLTWRERDWFLSQAPIWARALGGLVTAIVDGFTAMGEALSDLMQKFSELRIQKEEVDDNAELDQGSVGDVYQESDL